MHMRIQKIYIVKHTYNLTLEYENNNNSPV